MDDFCCHSCDRGSREAEDAEEGYCGIESPCQPGMRISTTATTSGQITRDGTEDLSAQVWQFCLAANLSTIRHPDNIRLGGAIFCAIKGGK